MPRITLTYTDNISSLNTESIFEQTHQILSSIADINTCKSSANKLTDYYIGNGDIHNAVLALKIILIPGRTAQIKNTIAQRIHDEIITPEIVPLLKSLNLNCEPTIEIAEFETYFKKMASGEFQVFAPESL